MAETAPARPIAAPFALRWSPRDYDSRAVEDHALAQVLEAARSAASSFNEQPWAYLLARREREAAAHAMLLACLVPGNQAWAARVPVLILALLRPAFAHGGRANPHAAHDLGQANACLAAQAAVLGLQAHQMAGFDPARARAAFAIPEGFDPLVMIALGHPAPGAQPPARERRAVADFTHLGAWGATGSPV